LLSGLVLQVFKTLPKIILHPVASTLIVLATVGLAAGQKTFFLNFLYMRFG
jgi:hypothetical protein